jgi:HSP20 family protein
MDENFSIVIRLRDLRKSKKLSQEELAEELGISRQSIIALEQGKFLPSLPLILTMCKFFDSGIDELLELPFELAGDKDNNGNIKNIINKPQSSKQEDWAGKETHMSQEIEPWRPFREMVSLRDAMDRLFEDSVITPRGMAVMPKIDIKDTKSDLVVKAELPGMKEEEIEVEIADGVMTISGKKMEEKETEEEGYYHKESHSGEFSRSFSLPSDVVADKAEADMKDGVLTIKLPKVEPKKATKVKFGKNQEKK